MTKFRVTFRTLKTWEVTPLRGKGHARFYRRQFLLPGSDSSCVVNFYYVSPIRPFMVFEKELSLKALSLSCWGSSSSSKVRNKERKERVEWKGKLGKEIQKTGKERKGKERKGKGQQFKSHGCFSRRVRRPSFESFM